MIGARAQPPSGRVSRHGRERLAVAGALITAAALRSAALVDLGRDIAILSPILDGRWSLEVAKTLAEGAGWGSQPFFMAPLYPHLLAPLVAVPWADPIFLIRLAQAGAGLLTWALAVRVAWTSWSPGAAAATGWILALSGPPLLYENLLIVDSWISLFLVTILWLDPARPSAGTGRAALAGVVAALAALGRASYLLLGPILWILLAASGTAGRRKVGWCALLWAVTLAPVAVHNVRHGAPGVLVSTNGGWNLFLGFHEGSRGGFHTPPDLAYPEDPTGVEAASLVAGRTMTEVEAGRFWARRAWDWIRGHPGDALRLELRRLGLWFAAYEEPQIEVFPVLRGRHPTLRWAPLDFGWLVALGLLGVGIARRGGDAGGRGRLWAGLALVCLFTSMITFAVGRFRLPAWPLLAVPAGGAVAGLVGWARRGEGARLLAGLVVVGALLLAARLMPRSDPLLAAAHFHHSLAQRHLEREENDAALAEADRALDLQSALGEAHHTRGVALARMGRAAEAIRSYERALQVMGPHPRTLQNLGVLYTRAGRTQDGVRSLEEAAARLPGDPLILTDLGVSLWVAGRQGEARRAWEEAAPGDPRAADLLRRGDPMGDGGAPRHEE